MKMLIVTAAFFAMTVQVSAAEQSCSKVASWCVSKGGTKESCYQADRMAQCKATGQYVAPNGNVWPAKKGS